MIDCEAMALRIERECYRQGMSIHEMLRYAGLNYRNLQNIRIAKRGPTAEVAEKICKALGKDPNWIHGWEMDDVSAVVRCQECAVPHNRWSDCPKLGGLIPPDDFYCAFGEQKEAGHD